MQRIVLFVCGMLLLPVLGCTKYVTVTNPPKVDLKEFVTIGVVQFAMEGSEVVAAEEVTHRFLASIQSAQPGVRLLELGTQTEVLKTVGHQTMDLKAIRALGEEYGVAAILTGVMTVSEVRPSFSLSQAMTSMSAKATVNGALRGKLRETTTGATIWTNGGHGQWTMGAVNLDSAGRATSYGFTDPGRKFEKMLTDLVTVATNDFRPTYVRRRVDD